jgi:hypothetical protein
MIPFKDAVVDEMIKRKIPLTRDNYLDFARQSPG